MRLQPQNWGHHSGADFDTFIQRLTTASWTAPKDTGSTPNSGAAPRRPRAHAGTPV